MKTLISLTPTIKWENDKVKLIDQTKLPLKEEYIETKSYKINSFMETSIISWKHQFHRNSKSIEATQSQNPQFHRSTNLIQPHHLLPVSPLATSDDSHYSSSASDAESGTVFPACFLRSSGSQPKKNRCSDEHANNISAFFKLSTYTSEMTEWTNIETETPVFHLRQKHRYKLVQIRRACL